MYGICGRFWIPLAEEIMGLYGFLLLWVIAYRMLYANDLYRQMTVSRTSTKTETNISGKSANMTAVTFHDRAKPIETESNSSVAFCTIRESRSLTDDLTIIASEVKRATT
jgi:hypothetical protein